MTNLLHGLTAVIIQNKIYMDFKKEKKNLGYMGLLEIQWHYHKDNSTIG